MIGYIEYEYNKDDRLEKIETINVYSAEERKYLVEEEEREQDMWIANLSKYYVHIQAKGIKESPPRKIGVG